MMKRNSANGSRWIAALVGGILPLAILAGCGGAAVSSDAEQQTVYVCRETSKPVVAVSQPTPAVHPETGRRTLMPALYCPKCRTWHPAPPLDVLQRSPGAAVCPKHKTPLRGSGPLPE